jgi:hypothetical protein
MVLCNDGVAQVAKLFDERSLCNAARKALASLRPAEASTPQTQQHRVL